MKNFSLILLSLMVPGSALAHQTAADIAAAKPSRVVCVVRYMVERGVYMNLGELVRQEFRKDSPFTPVKKFSSKAFGGELEVVVYPYYSGTTHEPVIIDYSLSHIKGDTKYASARMSIEEGLTKRARHELSIYPDKKGLIAAQLDCQLE